MKSEFGAAQPQFRSSEMVSAFDEFRGLISGPPVIGGSSFTALLELPPPQAVELLGKEDFSAKHTPPPIFPTDIGLVHRASKLSVFASADKLLESSAILSVSNSMKLDAVKQEQLDAGSRRNSSSPAGSDQSLKSGKRKEREKKVNSTMKNQFTWVIRSLKIVFPWQVKDSNKKSKSMVANEPSDDGGGEELPYVHVRARRGQATDSHSLAERVNIWIA